MNRRNLAFLALVSVLASAAVLAPSSAVLFAFVLLVVAALFIAPRIATLLFAAFLAFQPALVNVVGGRETAIGDALQRLDEFILVAGVLRVALHLRTDRTGAHRLWLVITAAFVTVGLAGGVLRGVPLSTAALGAFLAVKFPLFVLTALTIPWQERDAQRIVRGAVVAPIVILLLATILWFAPAPVREFFIDPGAALEEGFSRGGVEAMTAPFSHPGQLGWAMGVSGCFAVAAIAAGVVSARAGGSSVVAALIGIVASLRRKPLIAFPLAVLSGFFAGLQRKQRVYALAATLAATSLVAFVARARVEALISDTAANYLDPYNPTAARTLLYVTGWQIGARYFPLGAGFGRYGGYISQIRYSPIYDEYGLSNTYGLSAEAPYYLQDTYWPHILGETGWLGVALLAGFLILLWRQSMLVWRTAQNPWVRALGFGAAMALLETTIESAAAPVFEGTLFAYITAVPIAAALVLGRERKGPLDSA